MASDWGSGGVPAHLLGLILSHLPITDFIRFGAVCISWRQVATDYPHHRIPYLMLPGGNGGDNEGSGNFFNLSEQKVYHLPNIHGRRCLGSSDGWLVTMDDLAELHLLNPFTGAESSLPSITTFSFVKGVERDPDNNDRITGYYVKDEPADDNIYNYNLEYMRRNFFFKVVFFPSASIAVAIHGDLRQLSFARVGDESWTAIKTPFLLFWDVILDKGRRLFYAVPSGGFVHALDLLGDPKIIFIRPESTQFLRPLFEWQRHYLVKPTDGSDLLLQVLRRSINVPWDSVHDGFIPSDNFQTIERTSSFKIFQLDPSGLDWVEARSLGEIALFLGNNHSISISTKDCPELKANCIYFSDDDYMDAPHARRDMGVYNLQDGSIEPLFPHDSLLSRLTWPPPIWISPALS